MNQPPHPVPLPLRGGEGARRAGEGDVHGSDVRLETVGTLHEPTPHPVPLPFRWGEGRERGANQVHGPNAYEKTKGGFP